MTKRQINLARLSPSRRGLILGFLRGRQKSRKEMRAMAQSYDDELVSLQQQFDELASAYYRKCLNDAINEARIERATHPGMPLH